MLGRLLRKDYIIPFVVIGVSFVWAVSKFLRSQKRKLRFRERGQREILLIDTVEDWELAYPRLCERVRKIKAVGFDCEWVFWGHRLPVALIQIATYDGLCLLIRIYQMADCIPESLKTFLADRNVLKVGVSAKDDGKKLLTDYGLPVCGCVDLRHLLARIRGYNCPSQGLQGLASGILGVTMVKDVHIRCGDWEADTLSEDQINYAADDALIAIDILMQLISVKIYGIARRQTYYDNTLSTDDVSFWQTARSMCQGIVDVAFKNPKTASSKTDGDPGPSGVEGTETDTAYKPGKHKASYRAYMTRKRPLYYNCKLIAPDGTALTTCDIRKVDWYIAKGLGEKVSDDPLTVRLNFEPANRPESEHHYYLQDKANRCVVCGETEDYIRKLIVPQEYRKYFPVLLKDHSSHDVVLMCLPCHQRSSAYDMSLRQRLAVECDAPMEAGKDTGTSTDHDLQKIVSAAKALINNKGKIPQKRIEELEERVKNFYGVTSLTEDLLNRTVFLDTRVYDLYHIPHGQKVVEYYRKQPGGLLEFEKMWRRQFIETMEPKFLPNLWSVDHKPERMTSVDVNSCEENAELVI